jgi:hypothetical protein
MRSHLHALRLPLCFTTLLLGLVPAGLIAQKQDAPALPPAILSAHAFLTAVYPDLDLRGLSTTFRIDQGRVLIAVAPTSKPTDRKPVEFVPLVRASVEFDADGHVQSFAADGVYLEQARNLAFSDALKAHPNWTDSDAEVWLQQNAGRSVVGRTFAPPVNLTSAPLEAAFGARAAAQSAVFHWRSPGKAGVAAKFAGKPGWIVQVTLPGDKGPVIRYELEFEPIGERLVRVTRVEVGR